MRYSFVSAGSNSTLKSGSGHVYGVVAGGGNGGTVFLVDSIGIGVTPNYPTQLSNSSNLATYVMGAAGDDFNLFGVPFHVGLTVAATSNINLAVAYD